MDRVWKRLLAIVAVAGIVGVAGPGVAADTSRWSYAGASGPATWAKLEKDFAACALGKTQSPIDIPDAEARKGDLPPLLFDYRPTPLRIIDNGHTIQVNYAPGSTISVAGKRYELVEFHFHTKEEGGLAGISELDRLALQLEVLLHLNIWLDGQHDPLQTAWRDVARSRLDEF
jgi:carbonic anhydrase